jgi:histidinol-phosphatase
VSETAELANCVISISSRGGWVNSAKLEWFDNLCAGAARTRGFGDFYSYVLLAEGAVDIATEPELELYDVAALIPIVEGAGGVITDISGQPWNSAEGIKSALATNANLPTPIQ